MFCLLYVIIYIYIRLKSVLSLLSRSEAPYLYLSMSANEKKYIYIYIRERKTVRTPFLLFYYLFSLIYNPSLIFSVETELKKRIRRIREKKE